MMKKNNFGIRTCTDMNMERLECMLGMWIRKCYENGKAYVYMCCIGILMKYMDKMILNDDMIICICMGIV